MAMVKIKYLLRKDGLLYYQRGIPVDLRPHYSGRPLIRINLGTLDLGKAAGLCAKYAARDDVLWKVLRSGLDPDLTTSETRAAAEALLASWGVERGGIYGMSRDDPQIEAIENYMASRHGEIYIYGPFNVQKPDDTQTPVEHEAIRLLNETPATRRVFLTDALERYLQEHKRGSDPRFARDARRAIGIVVEAVGDLPLPDYTRDNARAVRESLGPGHSTATVRRRLDSISAVFNLGRREFDVTCLNPFEKLAIAREGLDKVKRVPFTAEEARRIEQACREVDDDIRWIIGFQLATGARLREIVGLRREDVFLECEIPHVYIRPHEALGRVLKTAGSERLVPLLGAGLWAARQALGAPDVNGWLFPRYAADNNIRADAASATVNKFFSKTLNIPRTTHSFRHAMKDLLRNVGVSEEMSKAILGHGTRTIADQYGTGFTLQRKVEALASLNPISGDWKDWKGVGVLSLTKS
jgi:integrase